MMLLPDMHAISAGLKATLTWWGSWVLEGLYMDNLFPFGNKRKTGCRRACGGHAYSSYNAIASLIADWGVMTTGGGDNFPLAQQCAVSNLIILFIPH